MAEHKRSEAVMKNLAEELLTPDECRIFKQALHHFRVSHSVTSLCQQLKPVISTTEKILLLIELGGRMPRNLQEDYHRLCGLQYPNYDTYLKIFTSGNSSEEIPKVIAQDSSGKFKIVSRGSEKKIMVKFNNLRNAIEVNSLPGTSVTSGIYSDVDDNDSSQGDVLSDYTDRATTPTYLKDFKNVRRVFLHRHNDGSMGFGITGGKEYGKNVMINVVEEDSPADKQGLRVGDRILEVNGTSFLDLTHAEAVQIMRNAWNLILMVQSAPLVTQKVVTTTVEPQLHKKQIHEMVLYPANGGRLGCTTQRLTNYNLLVKEIELHSPAEKAGLQVHDQVIKIDGIPVSELTEKQILMLVRSKRLMMTVARSLGSDESNIFMYPDADSGNDADYDSPFEPDRSSSPTPQMNKFFNSNGIPPEKQRRMHTISDSEILSDTRRPYRDLSHESRHLYRKRDDSYEKENFTPRSNDDVFIYNQRSRSAGSHPEHLIYGNKPKHDANWVLSPKTQQTAERTSRYTQRKHYYNKEGSYPVHVRNGSVGRLSSRDFGTYNSAVMRYVRSKSHSPHRPVTVRQIHQEDDIIRAIQLGLEKRQRAIRHSAYQMPNPADYEWDI